MKCPSDCSGGYMVPKVMCSICIEEYSGYNGGYGTRATLSADYIGKVLKLSIPGCRIY